MLHLVSLLPFLASAQAFFILTHPILLETRLDPIVNPGEVSQHVHTIVGGSNFDKQMTYESSQASVCTTAPVTVDKSNYWIPQLYYYNPVTEGYTLIPASYVNTYYLNRYGANDTIKAFPDGLRMISGDPNRRTFEAPDVNDQAITFVCLDYAGGHEGDPAWAQRNNFFEHNCPSGMRAQVNFPTCWDGVNLDSANHKDHVAWPTNGNNNGGGDCPASHPIKMVELFYEFIFNVQDFPFNAPGTPTWVFANGDATGYGLHADFINGWPTLINGTNVLQRAIDECDDNLGVGGNLGDCPAFDGLINNEQSAGCRPENPLVNEDIGYGHEISRLPGDNPLWTGNTTKPSDPDYVEGETEYTYFQSVIPTDWAYIGCIEEGNSGRALADYSFTSSNLTRANCISACSDRGYPLAAAEYGRECYCGFAVSNGATNTTLLDVSRCNTRCTGNTFENCGGSQALNLYMNDKLFPTPAAPVDVESPENPSVAAGMDGWFRKQNNCVAEPTNSRALTGYTVSNGQMTPALCMQTCQARGYKYAGTEYSSECYCGSSVDAGATEAKAGDCNRACSGDAGEMCGGASRLNFYSFDATAVTTPVTLPENWVATGCWDSRATNGKAFAGPMTANSGMTNDACMLECQSKGYALAGIEYGSECRCAQSFATGSVQVSASKCSMSCSGNSLQVCGAGDRMTTFRYTGSTAPSQPPSQPISDSDTPNPATSTWTYKGCYTESIAERAVSGAYSTTGQMTHELCIATAVQNGHDWAALVYGAECFTGLDINVKSVLTGEGECNFDCAGTVGEKCGGNGRASVFQLVPNAAGVAAVPTSSATPSSASSDIAESSTAILSASTTTSTTEVESSSISSVVATSSAAPIASSSEAPGSAESSSISTEVIASSSSSVPVETSISSASAVSSEASTASAATASPDASTARRGIMRRRGMRSD